MDNLKQEIGNFLKLLGAVLVVLTGGWLLFNYLGSDSGWTWLPRICGSAMVLAGSAASVILLFQKAVRIKVDTGAKSAEFAPAGENKP
jgi:hypothetical protein